jgi:hypothetical protein
MPLRQCSHTYSSSERNKLHFHFSYLLFNFDFEEQTINFITENYFTFADTQRKRSEMHHDIHSSDFPQLELDITVLSYILTMAIPNKSTCAKSNIFM